VHYAIGTLDREPIHDEPGTHVAPAAPAAVLLVVGNGMVGHRLCRTLVERGAAGRYQIVVVGEEPVPAYDRVHLTDVFEGRDEQELLLAPPGWYDRHGIELRLGERVVAIDREARIARTSHGAEIPYDYLVLATGSAPYVPPIEGTSLPEVFVYRALTDLHAIRHAALTADTAAVIGGGLLGLEAARALTRQDVRVTVVETAAALMPAQLDQQSAAELGRQVAALGIEVLTGTLVKRIVARGAQRVLHFSDGERRGVDMVVIATGVRPRIDLAAGCALACASDGGVVVDDMLRTSDPRIFAIGECASHRMQTYGVVAPGFAMADALAASLAGTPTPFRGARPTVRLKLLDVDVVSVGDTLDRGSVVRYASDGVSRLIRLERGRLVGALGVGAWDDFNTVQEAAVRHQRVWPWQAVRFARTGRLWAPQEDAPVTGWEPQAVVCNCLNVTRGAIGAACAEGAKTADDIAASTGASTLCGSCRPLLVQLAAAGPSPRPRVAIGLLALSLAAVLLCLGVLLVAPVPFSSSLQSGNGIDALWRNATLRQATGFTLLGLTLLAALLSVRKRWRRTAALGSFAAWRLTHAGLGVLTLLMLAVHTGARLGDNLNLALMTTFSVINIVGGLAGGATALDGRVGTRRWRRRRAATVLMHVLVMWPLPVLVAFHVLSVYYF
jgi:nitrite reductase (NADH) large subunit